MENIGLEYNLEHFFNLALSVGLVCRLRLTTLSYRRLPVRASCDIQHAYQWSRVRRKSELWYIITSPITEINYGLRQNAMLAEMLRVVSSYMNFSL